MRKKVNAEVNIFSKKNIVISISMILLIFNIAYITVSHYQSNSSWQYFTEDLKLGLQVEKYQKWKNVNSSEYLVNEANVVTSNTNYYRVAWLIIGSKLLMENPMGYGLLEYSFSHLAEKKWKDTNLAQAHNSWLDFALAFGFPGLILLLSANMLAVVGGQKNVGFNNLNALLYSVRSTLLVLDILWCTSEVDFKYSLPTMFFWIAFLTSLKNKH